MITGLDLCLGSKDSLKALNSKTDFREGQCFKICFRGKPQKAYSSEDVVGYLDSSCSVKECLPLGALVSSGLTIQRQFNISS